VGKTSPMLVLMNDQFNPADRIGKDTLTVWMDMVNWYTTDLQGEELI
jgi:hypothetical protein